MQIIIRNPSLSRKISLIFLTSFFRWLNPLLRQGYKKELQIEDLYKCVSSDQSARLGDTLER